LPLELELDLLLEPALWQLFPELADLPELMEPLAECFLFLCDPEPPETNSISFKDKTLISCSFVVNEELKCTFFCNKLSMIYFFVNFLQHCKGLISVVTLMITLGARVFLGFSCYWCVSHALS
jgi:hypothetical protein